MAFKHTFKFILKKFSSTHGFKIVLCGSEIVAELNMPPSHKDIQVQEPIMFKP